MDDDDVLESSRQRLIEWAVNQLERLLKAIIARRGERSSKEVPPLPSMDGRIVIEEVREIIELPTFDKKAAEKEVDPDSVQLAEDVKCELRDMVASIAATYRNNPFHNFEHCIHVGKTLRAVPCFLISHSCWSASQ